MTQQQLFIIHYGTKTVLAADECRIVGTVLPDKLQEAVENHTLEGATWWRSIVNPNLILSFEPEEIRNHFEGGAPGAEAVADMTDDELVDVADRALEDDRLWATFHEILVDAVQDFVDGRDEE